LGQLDFGFSKTAKETFKFWGGEDSVLARIVYMIRVLRPDVVISNHDTITTKPNRQHGHHQVCGITIYNAFEKAADPNYHPEQLTGRITPWQIKKLFFRTTDTTNTDAVEIDILKTDPMGRTIADIAIEALDKHRTQGMDKISKVNSYYYRNKRYELIRSDKMYSLGGDDLFAGLTPADKPGLNFELKSYPTYYNYRNVNPEDSLRLLKSLQYNYAAEIGIVKTYDNTIENILTAFGIRYDTISAHQLKNGSFGRYSTVILDIRAYFYRPELAEYNKYILEYIDHGGNVVCFYNKPGEWNNKNYAPYPIYLTNERVTEEDATVKTLNPHHWLFYGPNKIKNDIWDNWVQERSIYLPSDDTLKTSARYERLFEMNDENEQVPSTSLLYAHYGNGTYVYCSLALYRQLKVFNEGALKLFLNLIANQANWDGGSTR
jgi:hypothetical protein